VWNAFFSRFGRLTEIQRALIPAILEGRDALACSPTATGKTEAVAAPLVERYWSSHEWRILYVSPTRALINDLYERLHGPLEELGLRVARRTGDHREELASNPHILLTTPESFDSLLCRGKRTNGGHVLAGVAAVVLDEIHLLDCTPRGEQVRWLLERLRRLRQFALDQSWITSHTIQVVGLSATVSDPEHILRSFTTGGTTIQVGGSREIETVGVSCDSPAVEFALPAYLTVHSADKVLVFSDSRRRVDELAVSIRQPLEALGYAVRGHHGSLARRQREDTEEAIRSTARIVVFATSTLEIGIDIGDIDLIVLDGPPPSVAALLQRVGRGNRRTSRMCVLPCAGTLSDVLIHDAMITAAREGQLGQTECGPQFAVARQQVASYVFQAARRTRPAEALSQLIGTCQPTISAPAFLDHLVNEGELSRDGAGLALGEEWLERARMGEVHTNIEGRLGDTVVDQDTGRQIASGVRFLGGNGLAIAGEFLQVKAWKQRRLEVRRVTKASEAFGRWAYCSRGWMKGAGQARAVHQYLGLADGQWPTLPHHGGLVVFHFGGARRRAVIELILTHAANAAYGVLANEWFLELPKYRGSVPDWLTAPSPSVLELLINSNIDKLERSLARPWANKHLPMDLRVAEVRGWLDLPQEVELIQKAQWVPPPDEDVETALRILLDGFAGI
jgi:ATP-dependent Lhr-like helicase